MSRKPLKDDFRAISAAKPVTSKPSASTSPISSEISSAVSMPVPYVTVFFFVIADVAIPSGQLVGFSVENNTAPSMTFPNAEIIEGLSSAQMSYSASSSTASGIGIITAISSAVMYLFSHDALDTGFKPLSPFTNPATGSADIIGILVCFELILGSFFISCRTALSCCTA